MLERFETLGLPTPRVPDPIHISNPRLKTNPPPTEPRTWAIMLQHLDALTHFYLSSKPNKYEDTTERSTEYCIICEDDVLISSDFKSTIPKIATRFHQLGLDVLLLGYLTTIPLEIEPPKTNPHFPHIESHRFYGYPDDLWGSQMYMVSKEHARHLINTYTTKWATTNLDKPYSPDWILTKHASNRALIYPPLAIEDGETPTTHQGQRQFHRDSYEAQKNLAHYI